VSSPGRIAKAVLVVVALVATGYGVILTALPPPPIADAGPDITVDVGDAVAFDATITGGQAPFAYFWYVPENGLQFTTDQFSHAFTTQGVYQVTLIVRDGPGRYDLDTMDVTVRNQNPVARAGADLTATEDQVLAFDGSASSDADDALPDSAFAWDFADGNTANGPTPTHAFAKAGSYPVSLTVTDDQGAFSRDYVLTTITNAEPTAVMSVPSLAQEDAAVTFDASASTDTPSDAGRLLYAWDFGDGSKGAGETAVHTYTKAGTYTITLRVTDDNGARGNATQTILVENVAPVAAAGADLVIDEARTARFDGTGSTDNETDQPILEYAWDLDGDGVPDAVGSRPTRNYDDDASLTTTLTVTDDDGATGSDALALTVRNVAPLPAIVEAVPAASTVVDFTLRMAGEKWHDATMVLRENGTDFGTVTVFRNPGDPKEQQATLEDILVPLDSDFEAVVTYTPENDPVNGQPWGASPAWVVRLRAGLGRPGYGLGLRGGGHRLHGVPGGCPLPGPDRGEAFLHLRGGGHLHRAVHRHGRRRRRGQRHPDASEHPGRSFRRRPGPDRPSRWPRERS